MPAFKKTKSTNFSIFVAYARLSWLWHLLTCPALYYLSKYGIALNFPNPPLTFSEYYLRVYTPFFLPLITGFFAIYSAFRSYKKYKWFKRQSNINAIRRLSWQQFEVLIAAAFEKLGYSVEVVGGGGADGGKDILMRKKGKRILAQCKHWKSTSVGAPVIREMFGVMVAEKMDAVLIVTSGKFTKEALSFAKGKPIVLVNGVSLVKLLSSIQQKY